MNKFFNEWNSDIADIPTPPIYADMNGTAMRLIYDENGQPKEYYRDAGIWEVGFEFVDGKFVSVNLYDESMNYLSGHILTPITKEEWLKSNDGYVETNKNY